MIQLVENKFTKNNIIEDVDKKVKFPIEVFPEYLQEYMTQAYEKLGFHISYSGLSILTAIGTAVGGNVTMQMKRNWSVSANIWGVIVGSPSDKKTHALKYPFKELSKENSRLYEQFKEENKQHQEYLKSMKGKDSNEDDQSAPILKKVLVKDITIEKLAIVLDANPHGVCSLQDEMSGFFQNLNRYETSTKANYLELWSRGSIDVDRVGRESINVFRPYVPLIGNIQFEVLAKYRKKEDLSDGFMDRFLFALPDKKQFLSTSIDDIDLSLYDSLIDLINRIVKNRPDEEKIYHASEDFHIEYNKWKNEVTKDAYTNTPGKKESIITKLTEYVLRFSLIFFILDNNSKYIQSYHLDKAIKLYHYFKGTAFEILDMVEDANPLEFDNAKTKKVLRVLPDNFTTAQGLKIFEDHNFGKTFFYKQMKRKDLFEYSSHGHYTKKYD